MKILSNRLALVLAEYSELPSSVQKVIDGNNKKDINMKGVLRLYKCGDKYLYVLPELFEKSLRKESKVVQTKKQYGDFSLTTLSFASISIFSG